MDLYLRLTHTTLTLYMMLIILRWFGPWISLDLESSRFAWIARITDPLIGRLRKLLPPMGPIDFGPMAALFLVWFIRVLSVRVLEGAIIQGRL